MGKERQRLILGMFEKLEHRAEIAAHLSGPVRTDCSLQGLAVEPNLQRNIASSMSGEVLLAGDEVPYRYSVLTIQNDVAPAARGR